MTTDDDWQTDDVRVLCEAIVSLDNADDVGAFLRDLCTRREIADMASRWHIVLLLESGLSYREIASETGASTATVTRVSQWLHHGAGGYQAAIEKRKGTV